jgi:O-antigen/teichoic acid export membrane protein
LFLTNIINFVSNIAIFSIIGRNYGIEVFGRFSYIIVFTNFFYFLTTLGIDVLLIKDLSRNFEDYKKYINNIVSLLFISSVITIFSIVMIGPIVKPSIDVSLYFIGAVYLVLEAVRQMIRSVFYAIQNMRIETTATVIERALSLIMIFSFRNSGQDLYILISLLLLARFISVVFYISELKKIIRWSFHVGSLSGVYGQLLKSIPYGLNILISPFYLQLSLIMVSIFISDTATGIFKASSSLTMPFGAVAASVGSALFPIFSRKFQNGINITEYIEIPTKVITVLAVFISILLIVNAEDIITLVYDGDFYESVFLLKILAIIIPFRFINNILGMTLTSTDNQKYRTSIIFIATLINIAILYTFVQIYGLVGVALIAVGMEILIFVLFSTYLWKYMGVNVFKILTTIILLSICILYAAFYIIIVNALVSTLVYITLYILLIFMLRIIRYSEILKISHLG